MNWPPAYIKKKDFWSYQYFPAELIPAIQELLKDQSDYKIFNYFPGVYCILSKTLKVPAPKGVVDATKLIQVYNAIHQ